MITSIRWPSGLVVAACLSLLWLAACDDDPSGAEQIQVDRIEITPANLTGIMVDTSLQLQARVLDAQGQVLTVPVTWSSDNADVATVNATGLLVTHDHGAVRISASAGLQTAALQLNVEHHAAQVEFVSAAPPMRVTNQYQLQIRVLCPHGSQLQRTAQWTSQNPDIITVDQQGNLLALKAGVATVSVISDGVTATMQINVIASVGSVAIAPSAGQVGIGQTLRLTATVKDAAGNALTDRPLLWTSSNPGLASVDNSGLVTGLAAGVVTITAMSEQVAASATIAVNAVVANVTIDPTQVVLQPGGTAHLHATARDAQGQILNTSSVVWFSDNPEVATIEQSGMVTALAPGIATMNAMVDNVSGSARVSVSLAGLSLTISPAITSLEIGAELTLMAVLRDLSGNVLNLPITWSTSAGSIATITSGGVVRGVGYGVVTITATGGGVSGSVTINVGAPAASLEFADSSFIMAEGDVIQLQPILKDAAGNVLQGRSVKYVSSDVAVATVDNSGQLTAVARGTADITASTGGNSSPITAVLSVRVHPRVHGLNVTGGGGTLQPGQTQQLSAALTDVHGNPVTGRSVSWTTSDANVATVDGNGLVTAVAGGSATITATIDGVSATAVINVAAAQVATVDLIDPRVEIHEPLIIGSTLQFSAKAYDATGAEITQGVTFTWTSSDPAVATVDASGRVTGVARGTTVIKVAIGTLSDQADVRVVGSGQGGGGEEGFGANLSVPVIFSEGIGLTGLPVATDPGMRPLSTEAATGLAPSDGVGTFFWSGNYKDCPPGVSQYYCQRGENTWRAEWRNGAAAPINATGFFGDNLTHQTWNTSVPIRVEVVLTDPAQQLLGFNMPYVSGSGMTEMQGTDGITAAMTPTIYTRTPRLVISKLSGENGSIVQTVVNKAHYQSVDGPGNFGAEVTISGRLVYGYSLRIADYTLTGGAPLDGWWRIEFVLDDMSAGAPVNPNLSLTAIGNTAESEDLTYMPQLGPNGRSMFIDIYVTTNPGGGGGKGGGGGSGGQGGSGHGKPTATVTVVPSSYNIPTVGDSVFLIANVVDTDGNVVLGRAISWSSSDPSVATVDANGKVTGVSNGSAVITADSENRKGNANITVGPRGPGGGGSGGGGDEGFGNNLAVPVTFAEGVGITGLPVAQDPGLRPTSDEGITVGTLPFFYGSNVRDCQTDSIPHVSLYCQQGENTWQAQWLDAAGQSVRNAQVQWGDNLTHHTWNAHSPIRIEVVLNDLTTGPLQGYNMFYVSGEGPGEMWGTDGSTGSFTPTIYSVTPRLIAERIDTVGGNPIAGARAVDLAVWQSIGVDGPGGFGAEVNVAGKVIFGYNFRVQDVDNSGWPVHKYGWWRITFSLDDTSKGAPVNPNLLLTSLANLVTTNEEGETLLYTPKLGTDGKSSWVDIYIQQASGGGTGGGGGTHQ